MTLRLHWSPDSANLPVRIALEMFELSFEAERVDRAAGEHRSAAYRAKNPQGLIPVLEDDNLVLFETGAILWHLAEKVGQLGPDGPLFNDDPARVASLKWIFFFSNTVHADLRIAFYAERYIEDGAAELLREGIARRMAAHFDLVEERLRDRTAGHPICLPDIYLSVLVRWAQLYPSGCPCDGAAELLREGIARRMAAHFDLVEERLRDRTAGHPICLPDIYLSVLVRWAQLYPSGCPVIADLNRWPTIQAVCAEVELHPGSIRAFQAESIPPEQAITAPRKPDVPMAEILGVSSF